MAGLTSAKRWQLRRIFLQKRVGYSPAEAGRVLGIPRKSVVEMIERNAIDAKVRKTYLLPWIAIAEAALERHSLADVIEALGKQAPSVIPPLLFPAEPISVTLPIYLARMLEHLASVAGVTVDACLEAILREYAEELVYPTSQAVEEAIPGFNAALAFPDKPESLP